MLSQEYQLEFLGDEVGIKDGMSANVVITTNRKDNVISIPQGLVSVRSGKNVVSVSENGVVVEREVQTGDISSSGQIEILSGVNDGDRIPL